ncbi:bifunctional DNA primase/polymerase [bacterium]|nr:bifunctional DNA primase/polymerase [bacterium]
MLEAAIEYTSRGFYVIPLHNPREDGSCSCGKPDCTRVGKHPRLKKWQEKASCDPDAIRGWWKKWPSANIGIVLKPSGLVCLDADDEKTFAGVQKLLADCGVDTLTAKTSRGGHFYFSTENGDSFSGKLTDLDGSWSGEVLNNNLVVAPPSRHASGAEYSWVREVEPAPLPEELRSRLTRRKDSCRAASGVKGRKYYEKALDEEVERVRCSLEGDRNESLNKAAFSIGQVLSSGYIKEDDAFDRLLEAARDVGLSQREAFSTIESGLRKGKKEPRSGDDRPTIYTNKMEFKEQIELSLDALCQWNDSPRLFNSGGDIVRLERETEPPSLKTVSAAGLIGFMAESAMYLRARKTVEHEPATPPREIANTILANHVGRFPRLTGLLMTPTLREDGSILGNSGYDEETGYYLICPELGDQLTFVEESPTEALREIEDIIQDFPFKTEADRANALALIITAVIRPAIGGSAPLFVINAPVAGSGKTLLAKITSILEGRGGLLIDVPDKDDELMKRIQAYLLGTGGSGVMILDNHPSDKRLTLNSLASLITVDSQSIRRLCTSDMHMVKNRATVIVTGNNVQVGGDITRRVVDIRIEPKVPQPDKRTNFVHPDLKTYLQENRLRLVRAILTCAHLWYDAGQPPPTCPIFGSFEEWRRIVGGILEHAGVTGILGNRERIRETVDLDRVQWEEFLKWILKDRGIHEFTSADIEAALKDTEYNLIPDHLPEDLREKYEDRPSGFTRSLGKAFSARVGQRFNEDGLRLERSSTRHGKAHWRIVIGG